MYSYFTLLIIIGVLPTAELATIKVGITQSIEPNNLDKPGATSVFMITDATLNGLELGIDYVNNNIFPLKIDGIEYDSMELVVEDDEYDENVAYEIYKTWLENDEIDFYLSPYLSIADPPGGNISVTKLVEQHEKLFISTSSPYSTFSNYPNQWSFTLETTFESYMKGTVIPLRIQNAKSAIILNSITSTVGMCDDKFKDNLKYNGIEVLADIPFIDTNTSQSKNISTYPKEVMNNLQKIVDENIEVDPDIWYVCTGNSKLAAVVRMFMKNNHNYTPRAMVNICGTNWNNYTDIDSDLLGYITCITGTSDDTRYKDDGFGDLNDFKKLYTDKFGTEVVYNSYAELAALSIRILGEILQLSGTKDQFVNRDYLRRYTTTTFKGIISWDARHTQQNPGFLLQSNGTYMNIIAPYETATADHIYPEPEWFERSYNKNRYRTAEIIFMTITSLCIVSNILWTVFIFRNRENKTIKAGSPLFLYLILAGSTIAYIYNFVAIPSLSHTVASCHLKRWLLGIGFILAFASLFAKTWRVMILLLTKTLEVIVIRNIDVLLRVIGLTAVMVLMLTIMSILSPGVERISTDIHRPYYDYYQCKTNTAVRVLQWISISYGIVMFIIGAFLGFKVRSVPMNVYDESKIIGFSVYNVGFFGVLLLVINNVDLSYINKYIMTCVFLIICNLITVNSLMFHKLRYLNNPNSTKSSETQMSNIKTAGES